jgi:hypothetical protein
MAQKVKEGSNFKNQALLDVANEKVSSITKCSDIA